VAFLWTVTFELLCIYETALVLVIKLRRIPVGFHTSSASFDLRFCFPDPLLSFCEAYPLAPDLYTRLVTFWMAPKRSNHQKFEKEATMADGLKKSKLSKAEISSLVSRQLLRPRAVV